MIKALVDVYGDPIPKKPKPRVELVEAMAKAREARPQRDIQARYDAAQTTDTFANYWANADSLDADSANSREVRCKLVQRSRYEVSNNGYMAGIASTYATDLIGVGPSLRMQTRDPNLNKQIEREWNAWCKAIQFRRKLWTMAHAKLVDGEGIGILRRNPRVRHSVKLDIQLIETEQCQTPMLPREKGYVDGIRFDEFSNPLYYDVLNDHPGSGNWFAFSEPEQVDASFVLFWFIATRPGQHRGIPELTSVLNTGAAGRRFREAVVQAAETAADHAAVLHTNLTVGDAVDSIVPFSTYDIQKGTYAAMPEGWDMGQFKAEHPNSTYESFHKLLINELARPKSMPFNKAACDSSSYNYASGRLDHQTYYAALDVEREDCVDLVLEPLFAEWFAGLAFRLNLHGVQDRDVRLAPYAHVWDWPNHRVADVESDANANDKRLRNGALSLSALYTEQGLDWLGEELPKAAESLNLEPEQLQNLIARELFPEAFKTIAAEKVATAARNQPQPQQEAGDAEAAE